MSCCKSLQISEWCSMVERETTRTFPVEARACDSLHETPSSDTNSSHPRGRALEADPRSWLGISTTDGPSMGDVIAWSLLEALWNCVCAPLLQQCCLWVMIGADRVASQAIDVTRFLTYYTHPYHEHGGRVVPIRFEVSQELYGLHSTLNMFGAIRYASSSSSSCPSGSSSGTTGHRN